MRLLPPALGLILCLTAAAPVEPANDVAQLLAAYRAAWANADAKALASLYTPDAELVSLAATADGRAAIEQLYDAAFAGMGRSTLTTRLERVRQVMPGVAYGRGAFRISANGAATACGRFVAVLARRGAAWRIAAFTEAALACDEFPQ